MSTSKSRFRFLESIEETFLDVFFSLTPSNGQMGSSSVIFNALWLLFTLISGISTTIILSYAFLFSSWETMKYSSEKLKTPTNLEQSISKDSPTRIHPLEKVCAAIPLEAGVWSACVDMTDEKYNSIKTSLPNWGENRCLNIITLKRNPFSIYKHPKNDLKPHQDHSRWIKNKRLRMNNLILSCSLTSVIILFSCLIIFPIGLAKKQVPSILIVSVLYVLSGLFAFFALSIWELNRKECGSTLLLSALNIHGTSSEKCSIGILSRGFGIILTWTGILGCFISSFGVYILSKLMRGKCFLAE